jgi:hypothetical protein
MLSRRALLHHLAIAVVILDRATACWLALSVVQWYGSGAVVFALAGAVGAGGHAGVDGEYGGCGFGRAGGVAVFGSDDGTWWCC